MYVQNFHFAAPQARVHAVASGVDYGGVTTGEKNWHFENWWQRLFLLSSKTDDKKETDSAAATLKLIKMIQWNIHL